MNKIIYSQRLILKTINESYAEQVLDFVLRNKQFLIEWEIQRDAEYYSIDVHRQLLIDDSLNIDRGQLFKVWIYKSDQPNRIIGSISLNNIIRGAFQSCHLGYRIDQEEQRKGYMTEAIREVILYAFNELKLHRIEANIMPLNKASLRVVEKLGFCNEGLGRKYLKINGIWEDHIHMVLLNNEEIE
ncbi:GNAT family N-acetyltransferase [Paenibacillus sp. SYP-B4298]|uniref:GNAT family N-acetyltransferase n=1 Tax=Paenibacillus sp. SYP-B4298 TaxID=2996034 RepID=UPI0022DCFF57|nr:GNAT family N-acetyltransferase [Paenibacillus sp. SYP-B4298]